MTAGIHVRQQVCNQIAALVSSLTYYPTGKVFLSRTAKLMPSELPCAIVVFENEQVSQLGSNRPSAGLQERSILTAVYLFERNIDNVELALDNVAGLVEAKVFTDSTLQGVAQRTILENTESFVRSDPSLPTGAYRLLFNSTVFTMEGNPYKAIQQ